MNSASRRPLVMLGVIVASVIGALSWATTHALRLEQRERLARAEAAFEESIRLALWRVDTGLTPIITREAVRPYFEYQAFYAADRGYTSMWQDAKPGEALVPSPLLQSATPYVRVHFQRSLDGRLISPQVPVGSLRQLAESAYVSGESIASAETAMGTLGRMLIPGPIVRAPASVPAAAPSDDRAVSRADSAKALRAAVKEEALGERPAAAAEKDFAARRQALENVQVAQQQASNSLGRNTQTFAVQSKHDLGGKPAPETGTPAPASVNDQGSERVALKEPQDAERALRKSKGEGERAAGAADRAPGREVGDSKKEDALTGLSLAHLQENGQGQRSQDSPAGEPQSDEPAPAVVVGEQSAEWYAGADGGTPQLLLTRTVHVGETVVTQGCWLDWEALRGSLCAGVDDLLPGVTLEAIVGESASLSGHAASRRLAAIPAVLNPGSMVAPASPGWSPMRSTLAVTWSVVLAALGGLGVLLGAARELAERRGRFVSAVTHELRTPLTTFVMYSQMLADGMVAESARGEYLSTLKRESQRLAGIVENVLEYARLSRRTRIAGTEAVGVVDVLGRIIPEVRQRCDQARVGLVVASDAEPTDMLRVDTLAMERALLNLVDNACKYACDGEACSVVLRVTRERGRLVIRVIDHGRGITPSDRTRLFTPFQRGSRLEHAATSGLGLGLALSRDMARRFGGDITLERSSGEGSVFVLSFPLERRE